MGLRRRLRAIIALLLMETSLSKHCKKFHLVVTRSDKDGLRMATTTLKIPQDKLIRPWVRVFPPLHSGNQFVSFAERSVDQYEVHFFPGNFVHTGNLRDSQKQKSFVSCSARIPAPHTYPSTSHCPIHRNPKMGYKVPWVPCMGHPVMSVLVTHCMLTVHGGIYFYGPFHCVKHCRCDGSREMSVLTFLQKSARLVRDSSGSKLLSS